MSKSARRPKLSGRSKPSNLNLRPARGGKGYIIPINRLSDLVLPVDKQVLTAKHVVVEFSSGGTRVGLVEPSFHIPFDAHFEDLNRLGRARGLVQRTLRKEKSSQKKDIELSIIEAITNALGIDQVDPLPSLNNEMPEITKYYGNIEESEKIIRAGTSTNDAEDKFQEESLRLLEQERKAVDLYVEKCIQGTKGFPLEDSLLVHGVPHHFFRKTAEAKLSSEMVNNTRKIFFPGNLSSTLTISLREALDNNFVLTNKFLLERTRAVLALVNQDKFVEKWFPEVKTLKPNESKWNRLYKSAIYVVPTHISLKTFLFQKNVSGRIPNNEMLPILTTINETMTSIVFGRFSRSLDYTLFWKTVTGETDIPPESVSGDTRDRLSKALKTKDIPLDKFFPESENLKTLLFGFLPSDIATKLGKAFATYEFKLEQKKVPEARVAIKLSQFSSEKKGREKKYEERFSPQFRGKFPRWFEKKPEKKISNTNFSTELDPRSSKILAELVRKDKRYLDSVPRIKAFLRMFSSLELQVTAAKIMLASREEVITAPRQEDFEENEDQNVDEAERLVAQAPEAEREDGE